MDSGKGHHVPHIYNWSEVGVSQKCFLGFLQSIDHTIHDMYLHDSIRLLCMYVCMHMHIFLGHNLLPSHSYRSSSRNSTGSIVICRIMR